MPAATVPRIVFVNRHYWPSEAATAQLLTDLAEGLAGRGRSVAVVASHDGSVTTSFEEDRRGVHISRVRATRWGRRSLLGKACDYLTFTLACRRVLPRRLQERDWLVPMTDPPTLALVAAAAGRRTNVRVAHWIQDIHPEISLALPGRRILRLLSIPWIRRRDAAWRSAEACIAISQDMAAVVAEHGVPPAKIQVIHNWAPGGGDLTPVAPDQNPLRREWNVADQFVVAYSGNLGRVHALEPVLAAAALLRDDRRLTFLFIGDGPQRPALQAAVAQRRLTNVRFLPPQPRDRLAESLSVGDVHLVTLRAGCERFVYPSKLYGVLAAGRPIVFVGPPRCELAEAVRRRGAGLVADPNDPGAVAAAIRALHADPARREKMGRAAADWFRATGGLRSALDDWEKLLHEPPRQT